MKLHVTHGTKKFATIRTTIIFLSSMSCQMVIVMQGLVKTSTTSWTMERECVCVAHLMARKASRATKTSVTSFTDKTCNSRSTRDVTV